MRSSGRCLGNLFESNDMLPAANSSTCFSFRCWDVPPPNPNVLVQRANGRQVDLTSLWRMQWRKCACGWRHHRMAGRTQHVEGDAGCLGDGGVARRGRSPLRAGRACVVRRPQPASFPPSPRARTPRYKAFQQHPGWLSEKLRHPSPQYQRCSLQLSGHHRRIWNLTSLLSTAIPRTERNDHGRLSLHAKQLQSFRMGMGIREIRQETLRSSFGRWCAFVIHSRWDPEEDRYRDIYQTFRLPHHAVARV